MAGSEFDIIEELARNLRNAAGLTPAPAEPPKTMTDPMPPARIREIRRGVARSAKAFEKRFGIPASTVSNWEQGRRKPDPAGRLLLQVIEIAPDIVERAARAEE